MGKASTKGTLFDLFDLGFKATKRFDSLIFLSDSSLALHYGDPVRIVDASEDRPQETMAIIRIKNREKP